MKTYARLNDPNEGDIVANCMNATKTSNVGTGHSSLRSSKQKRRLRKGMKSRKRLELKKEMKKDLE